MSTKTRDSKHLQNQRLTTGAWALFFIMIGGLWLVPGEVVPPGSWALGIGIILLGLNAMRIHYGIPVCISTVIIGLVAVACGLGGLLGFWLPLLPVVLILFGASLLLNGRFTGHKRSS